MCNHNANPPTYIDALTGEVLTMCCGERVTASGRAAEATLRTLGRPAARDAVPPAPDFRKAVVERMGGQYRATIEERLAESTALAYRLRQLEGERPRADGPPAPPDLGRYMRALADGKGCGAAMQEARR